MRRFGDVADHNPGLINFRAFGAQQFPRSRNEENNMLNRAGEGISEPLSDILYNMLSDELFKYPATQIESLVLSCR